MKIKLYNKIASCGIERLPKDFTVGEEMENPDAILVRSADLHEIEFGTKLKAIARAGAGVNNIPLDRCTEKGICVFNTPGANAEAVKELCIAALLLTSRRIEDGVEWAKTLAGNPDAPKIVEKEKSKFQGPEIFGKKLGVIGLGAVGGNFANAAIALGMCVLGYDPFVSVNAAWSLNPEIEKTDDINRVFAECDYISVHVPSLPSTRGMLCKDAFAKCKDGVRILNLARADLAVDNDILEAIASGKIAAYFTDFPNAVLAGKPGIIATPHLGASTPEAEDNCAVMACDQTADYLLNGNIKNSVNFPCVSMARSGKYRVAVFYHSNPETDSSVMKYLFGCQQMKSTRNGNTYVLSDGDEKIDLSKIYAVSGVIKATAY